MKVIVAVVALCSVSFADVNVPTGQKGLLILPNGSPTGSLSAPYKNYRQQQAPEILSPEFAEKRGVYFVQVPQERIQALQAQNQQVQNNFQNSQATSRLQEATPVNVRYLPLEEPQNSFSGFSGQYRQEQTSDEATIRFLPISLGEVNPGPAAFRSQQQQEEPTGYYASLKYSPVQPIQGPVYSYKPEGLTRILRYAPVY